MVFSKFVVLIQAKQLRSMQEHFLVMLRHLLFQMYMLNQSSPLSSTCIKSSESVSTSALVSEEASLYQLLLEMKLPLPVICGCVMIMMIIRFLLIRIISRGGPMSVFLTRIRNITSTSDRATQWTSTLPVPGVETSSPETLDGLMPQTQPYSTSELKLESLSGAAAHKQCTGTCCASTI